MGTEGKPPACPEIAKLLGANLAGPPIKALPTTASVPKPLSIIPVTLGIPGSTVVTSDASSVPLPKFAAVSGLSAPPPPPPSEDGGDDRKNKKGQKEKEEQEA